MAAAGGAFVFRGHLPILWMMSVRVMPPIGSGRYGCSQAASGRTVDGGGTNSVRRRVRRPPWAIMRSAGGPNRVARAAGRFVNVGGTYGVLREVRQGSGGTECGGWSDG